MTDPNATPTPTPPAPTPEPTPKTFTEAELNDIVQDRLKQQAKNKFGDYDALKAKAGESQTLEERVAGLETELSTTKAGALRTSIAAQFGISTKKGSEGEASDADLFLTGSDEATLTAQAERLAGRAADTKRHGNVAPKEGETKNSGKDTEVEAREFVGALFGGGAD